MTASDGNGGSDTVAVTVPVTDVEASSPPNTPPVIGGGASVTITVAEDATGSIGDAFSATDADTGDTITWSVGGTGASSFDISGGQLSLASGATLDYEAQSSYSVTVTASDGTDSDSVAVTVTVNEVESSSSDNPPVIGALPTDLVIREQTTGNVGSPFTATDADGDTITWSVSGTGASTFDISGGQLSLASGVTLDYETQSSYSITVTASDGNGGSDTVAVTVPVTDVEASSPPNTPPVIGGGASVTITVAEDATGSIGDAFTATDADTGDTITWSVGGTGASSFDISGGQLSLASGVTLDYETKASYSITVTASDGTAEPTAST